MKFNCLLSLLLLCCLSVGASNAQTIEDAMTAKAMSDQAYLSAMNYRSANTVPASHASDEATIRALDTKKLCTDPEWLAEGNAEYALGNADWMLADGYDADGVTDLNNYQVDQAAARAAALVQNWAVAIDRWDQAAQHMQDAEADWAAATSSYQDAESHYLTAEALYALGAGGPPPAP